MVAKFWFLRPLPQRLIDTYDEVPMLKVEDMPSF